MIWGYNVTDIKQRLALRAELKQRQIATGAREEMMVIWAIDANSASETNAQIDHLANRAGRLFKMPLSEQVMEKLAQFISPKTVPGLLEGLVIEIEEGNKDKIDLNTLSFLLPALMAMGIDYTENMRALLKGRLYYALCEVLPIPEAASAFEALALKHDAEKYCVVFNSFYEHTLQKMVQSPAISTEDQQHLSTLARSAHFNLPSDAPNDVFNSVSEVSRWIKQFEYLSALRAGAHPTEAALIDVLIEKRASNLAQWCAIHSPGVALAPFSGVKSITSNAHAHKVLDTCIMMVRCIDYLADDNKAARDCVGQLATKLIQGLSRFNDSLGSKWQKFEERVAQKADWHKLVTSLPAKHRKVVVDNFIRTDLFGDYLNEQELAGKFEEDLGL
jgi:hypothetical protein